MRTCERCGHEKAVERERYCTACKKAVKQEMQDSGYLTNVPIRHYRNANAAGPRHCDGGSWDNVIRILEDG